MSPEQFLNQLQRGEAAPVCLLLGAEPYRREVCRKALIRAALGEEDAEAGLSRFDLRETSWREITDDACSLSLFVRRRLLWVTNAEAALPRGRAAEADAEEPESPAPASIDPLLEYLKRPAPGVTIAVEASRFELDGEDKAKAERVKKLYAAIPVQVEFPRLSAAEARQIAQRLAQKAGLRFTEDALDALVEALGADGMRIANEIEKLRLHGGFQGPITAAQLAMLVPDSSVSTIFALVDALGRRDRKSALEITDRLLRQGEYMPLALSFLAGLLRLALAAREMGLRTPQQVQNAFSRPGRPVWPSRAQQILQAARMFSGQDLGRTLIRIFETDRAFRDARPDDRLVMENFIFGLAGSGR